jgi:hypothetical protein
MSSLIPQPDVSLSQFQDLFDAALSEYNQKTGKDITTDPLTARLQHCDSSDAVLVIIQEQAYAFNQYRNGDWKVQLMRKLKPTVDILFGLSTSGVFGEGIGLVRLTQSIFALWKIITPLCRDFHRRMQYLPESASYSLYVSLPACSVCGIKTQVLKGCYGS